MCTCTGKPEVDGGSLPVTLYLSLVFEAGSLTESGTHPFVMTSQLASSGCHLPALASPALHL